MTQNEAINYWLRTAGRDQKTAHDLLKSGHYSWSLFIWQLVLERLLKAHLVKKNKAVPPIHNLLKLAKLAEIKLNDNLVKELAEITSFNLEARYDDYKEQFYKKATKEFTEKWSEKAKRICQWLKNQL